MEVNLHGLHVRSDRGLPLSRIAACAVCWLLLGSTGTAWSQYPESVVEGFSEPYRQVRVAFSEAGILREVTVHEGHAVNAGSVIARLDDRVQQVMLEIAKANREAHGELDAAVSEHRLRQERWKAFEALQLSGHATEEELLRAKGELELAEGQLRSAQEKRAVRELEYDRVVAQMHLLEARCPVSGVVTQIHKQPGEYVGAIDPVVATVVQIDTLAVVFMFPRERTLNLRTGDAAEIRFVDSNRQASGVVEFISPVTNAESNTVTVRVRVPNPEGKLSAGERCQFVSAGSPSLTKSRPLLQPTNDLRKAAALLRRLPAPTLR